MPVKIHLLRKPKWIKTLGFRQRSNKKEFGSIRGFAPSAIIPAGTYFGRKPNWLRIWDLRISTLNHDLRTGSTGSGEDHLPHLDLVYLPDFGVRQSIGETEGLGHLV